MRNLVQPIERCVHALVVCLSPSRVRYLANDGSGWHEVSKRGVCRQHCVMAGIEFFIETQQCKVYSHHRKVMATTHETEREGVRASVQ